jgi:hypothetical protein
LAILELAVFLPQLLKCWDYRYGHHALPARYLGEASKPGVL